MRRAEARPSTAMSSAAADFDGHRLVAEAAAIAGDMRDEQALQQLDHARNVGLRRFDSRQHLWRRSQRHRPRQMARSQDAAFRTNAPRSLTKVGNPHGCPPGETPLATADRLASR